MPAIAWEARRVTNLGDKCYVTLRTLRLRRGSDTRQRECLDGKLGWKNQHIHPSALCWGFMGDRYIPIHDADNVMDDSRSGVVKYISFQHRKISIGLELMLECPTQVAKIRKARSGRQYIKGTHISRDPGDIQEQHRSELSYSLSCLTIILRTWFFLQSSQQFVTSLRSARHSLSYIQFQAQDAGPLHNSNSQRRQSCTDPHPRSAAL